MLKGIDVSWYKRDLRVANVAADFIIAKATGGTGYVDGSCDMFVQAARNLGRKFGVYHYYSDGYGGDDPIAEADFFVDNCQGYVGDGVLVLDWERGNNPHWQDVGRAKQWLDHVYARTRVRPMIYMSLSVVQSLDWSAVIQAGYGLWVAAYVDDATPIANYQMDTNRDPNPEWDGRVRNILWQFTSTGRLDGYGGNLDCNFFYGDGGTWDAYAARVPAPGPEPAPAPTTTTTTSQAPVPQPTTTTTTTAAPTTTTTTTAVRQAPENPFGDLAKISKALAAFLAGTIAVWLAKHGIHVDGDLAGLLSSLLSGLLVALTVYISPKNKESQ